MSESEIKMKKIMMLPVLWAVMSVYAGGQTLNNPSRTPATPGYTDVVEKCYRCMLQSRDVGIVTTSLVALLLYYRDDARAVELQEIIDSKEQESNRIKEELRSFDSCYVPLDAEIAKHQVAQLLKREAALLAEIEVLKAEQRGRFANFIKKLVCIPGTACVMGFLATAAAQGVCFGKGDQKPYQPFITGNLALAVTLGLALAATGAKTLRYIEEKTPYTVGLYAQTIRDACGNLWNKIGTPLLCTYVAACLYFGEKVVAHEKHCTA